MIPKGLDGSGYFLVASTWLLLISDALCLVTVSSWCILLGYY